MILKRLKSVLATNIEHNRKNGGKRCKRLELIHTSKLLQLNFADPSALLWSRTPSFFSVRSSATLSEVRRNALFVLDQPTWAKFVDFILLF